MQEHFCLNVSKSSIKPETRRFYEMSWRPSEHCRHSQLWFLSRCFVTSPPMTVDCLVVCVIISVAIAAIVPWLWETYRFGMFVPWVTTYGIGRAMSHILTTSVGNLTPQNTIRWNDCHSLISLSQPTCFCFVFSSSFSVFAACVPSLSAACHNPCCFPSVVDEHEFEPIHWCMHAHRIHPSAKHPASWLLRVRGGGA